MRTIARLALLTAAVTSLAAMFQVGSRNQSTLLMVLFAGWILLPLVSLALFDGLSRPQTPAKRSRLHLFSIAIALFSIAGYSYQVIRPRVSTPAAPFLLIPLASWGLMAVFLVGTFLAARKGD